MLIGPTDATLAALTDDTGPPGDRGDIYRPPMSPRRVKRPTGAP